MIESRTTRSFRTSFAALPEEIQAQARRAYRLFRADPAHPSLRFKKLEQTETFIPFASDLAIALSVFSKDRWWLGFGSAPMLTMTVWFEPFLDDSPK